MTYSKPKLKPLRLCALFEPRPLRQATVEVKLTGIKAQDEEAIVLASSQLYKDHAVKAPSYCPKQGARLGYEVGVAYANRPGYAKLFFSLVCPACRTLKKARENLRKKRAPNVNI